MGIPSPSDNLCLRLAQSGQNQGQGSCLCSCIDPTYALLVKMMNIISPVYHAGADQHLPHSISDVGQLKGIEHRRFRLRHLSFQIQVQPSITLSGYQYSTVSF